MTVNNVHHLMLTVTDLERAKAFYTDILGFEVFLEGKHRVSMMNGEIRLGLSLPPDPEQALENDVFSEHRVGLDHISFDVGSPDDLEQAAQQLDKHGINRGEIRDLSEHGYPMMVMAFRDPDNIQLELCAYMG